MITLLSLSRLLLMTIAIVFATVPSGFAFDLKKVDSSSRNGNVDSDFEFTVNKAEANTLGSTEMKATLLVFCTQALGPLGPVAAKFVGEHLDQIKQTATENGAYIKMTIRNGTGLHIWEVYPL